MSLPRMGEKGEKQDCFHSCSFSPSQVLVHAPVSGPQHLWALGKSKHAGGSLLADGGGPSGAGLREKGGRAGLSRDPTRDLGVLILAQSLGLCDLGQLLAFSGPDLPDGHKEVVFALGHS